MDINHYGNNDQYYISTNAEKSEIRDLETKYPLERR